MRVVWDLGISKGLLGSSESNIQTVIDPVHQNPWMSTHGRDVGLANPEHVTLVRQGVGAIEEWRLSHPKEHLDLRGADFSKADLSRADLSEANLREARLSEAILIEAILFRTNISGACLSKACLWEADLSGADLHEADLDEAQLLGADLTLTDLSKATLTNALFVLAQLRRTRLYQANLSHASIGRTSIVDCNLSEVKGLQTIRHIQPSHVDVDTLIESFRGAGNKLTLECRTFFRNAGVPEELLKELPRIISEIKYYSAFMAYGEPDREYAERLVNDLRARGVPCWFYPTDYTPGKRTWLEIGNVRREAEKIIVLCSVRSLIPDGLLKELEDQINENPDKMIPVSLDPWWQEKGFLVQRAGMDLKPFLLDKNYANFHSKSVYEESFEKLLKGLRRS